jgi:hypothetical protein
MTAGAHLLVAIATDDGGKVDALWDFCDDAALRLTGDPNAGVGVHALPPDHPRYCVHPTSSPDIEFRADDLAEALAAAGGWLTEQLGPEVTW